MYGAYISGSSDDKKKKNPESLEAITNKAENGELSEQQAEMFNKWATTMGTEGVKPEGEAPEAEPQISETEPQIMQDFEENMAADELPTDEPTGDDTTLETDDTIKDEDVPDPIAPKVVAGAAKIAVGLTADNPIEAHVANAAIDATENAVEEHIKEERKEEMQAEADAAKAEAAQAAESSAPEGGMIQHFSETESASTFQPLSKEEQDAQRKAAEANHAQTYSEPGEADNFHAIDQDNLVANAVADNLADGGIGLSGVGETLEREGVSVQDEATELSSDISQDLAEASMAGDSEDTTKDTVTANNLAVESASMALAAKEAAEEADTAEKVGGSDALDLIAAANEKADEFATKAVELADASAGVSNATGEAGPHDMLTEAREMADAAKETATKAKEAAEDAAAEEETEKASGEDDTEEEDDKKPGEDSKYYDKTLYPELAELDNGEAKAITG